MGCITFVLLVLNIIALVAIDIMFWAESAASGLAGVFGIIAFFIGYALSVEVTIAPRDFWVNSAFGIFIKKLGVANMTAFVFICSIQLSVADIVPDGACK